MTEETTEYQTITLNDDRSNAVYTKDGKVFYNLEVLHSQFLMATAMHAVEARVAESNDMLNMVRGEKNVLDAIRDSVEALRAEYALYGTDAIEQMLSEEGE